MKTTITTGHPPGMTPTARQILSEGWITASRPAVITEVGVFLILTCLLHQESWKLNNAVCWRLLDQLPSRSAIFSQYAVFGLAFLLQALLISMIVSLILIGLFRAEPWARWTALLIVIVLLGMSAQALASADVVGPMIVLSPLLDLGLCLASMACGVIVLGLLCLPVTLRWFRTARQIRTAIR